MLLLETDADVAKLADALDLGSSSERSEGSSPFIRISKIIINLQSAMAVVELVIICYRNKLLLDFFMPSLANQAFI